VRAGTACETGANRHRDTETQRFPLAFSVTLRLCGCPSVTSQAVERLSPRAARRYVRVGDVMKRIVSVSLGSSAGDYESTSQFLGETFHVRRVGADWDVGKAEALLERHEQEADAIGIGMVQDHATVGTRSITDRLTSRLERKVTRVPATTGARLRTFFDEWAIRHVQREQGDYFTNARVLFLSGIANYRIASVLSEYTKNLRFADPAAVDGVPMVLGSLRSLETYVAATATWRARRESRALAEDGPRSWRGTATRSGRR